MSESQIELDNQRAADEQRDEALVRALSTGQLTPAIKAASEFQQSMDALTASLSAAANYVKLGLLREASKLVRERNQ